MLIPEQRTHVSLLVRQEGFQAWMNKIKNKFRFGQSMKDAINLVK